MGSEMKIVNINNKKCLTWGYHELAWSRRTCGFPIYLLDKDGKILKTFYSVKHSGYIELPKDAKYILRTYRTNKGYPSNILYEITGNEIKAIAHFGRSTTIEDVLKLPLPENLKKLIIKETFGQDL